MKPKVFFFEKNIRDYYFNLKLIFDIKHELFRFS